MTLKEAVEILKNAGVENPLYDAREIFHRIGKIPRERLVLGGETEDGSDTARAVFLRAERTPLEYIIGNVDFYRETYLVCRDCLIPRDDTEILVDFAVKNIPSGANIIDLCTGSGCVALSVLNNTDKTRATAADISEGALALAKKNAERLGLSDRVEFLLCDALEKPVAKSCFAVLCNPPYVTEDEYPELSPEIHKEPKIAFVGGKDGLDFYRRITELYRDVIDDSGFIAFEIGCSQAKAIFEIANSFKMSCQTIPDLSGHDRVCVLRKSL